MSFFLSKNKVISLSIILGDKK